MSVSVIIPALNEEGTVADVVRACLADEPLEVLVIDTKVSHAHSTGGYGERRAACERGAAIMGVGALRDIAVGDLPRAQELMDDVTFRRVRHVVTENQRVRDAVRTLREDGPRAIGGLLDASHASMRDDFEISTPELDLAVAVARDAGAIGARMTGGGFGGRGGDRGGVALPGLRHREAHAVALAQHVGRGVAEIDGEAHAVGDAVGGVGRHLDPADREVQHVRRVAHQLVQRGDRAHHALHGVAPEGERRGAGVRARVPPRGGPPPRRRQWRICNQPPSIPPKCAKCATPSREPSMPNSSDIAANRIATVRAVSGTGIGNSSMRCAGNSMPNASTSPYTPPDAPSVGIAGPPCATTTDATSTPSPAQP